MSTFEANAYGSYSFRHFIRLAAVMTCPFSEREGGGTVTWEVNNETVAAAHIVIVRRVLDVVI